MAKYTMLLTEYLERGGQLPTSFSLIEGFEDLFIRHFCDKEIGFETPYLFEIKLQEKADLYIDLYVSKIAKLAASWLKFDAPVKVHYTKENKSFTGGKQHGATTELPFDNPYASTPIDVTPSVVTDTDEYKNTENRGNTLEESGDTHDEVMASIDFLNKEIQPLLSKLLKEFNSCFMRVY